MSTTTPRTGTDLARREDRLARYEIRSGPWLMAAAFCFLGV